MVLIDFILNLVAMVFWLNWRSQRFDPLTRTTPATLVGTLKRANPRPLQGWPLLAGGALLLVARALVYNWIGEPADWVPRLDLGLVVLAFPNHSFGSALLYSFSSFVRFWIVFYFWLLTLVMLNRGRGDAGEVIRLGRLHLGWLARWPWTIQLLLPPLFCVALWLAAHPLLYHDGVLAGSSSGVKVLEQGMVVYVGLLLTLKYLLPVVLLLHLIACYVYLGSNPLWDFVSGTARTLLAALKPLPLQFAKVDLAPFVGVVILFLLLHWLPRFILEKLAECKLPLWPQ